MESASTSELSQVRQQLNQVIYELDALCAHSHIPNDAPGNAAALILGRRIAPSTVPPLFLRFDGESGPMEPMPARFHVPFPTLEDFRYSVLNVQQSVVLPPKPVAIKPARQTSQMPLPPDEDEYGDDF